MCLAKVIWLKKNLENENKIIVAASSSQVSYLILWNKNKKNSDIWRWAPTLLPTNKLALTIVFTVPLLQRAIFSFCSGVIKAKIDGLSKMLHLSQQ